MGRAYVMDWNNSMMHFYLDRSSNYSVEVGKRPLLGRMRMALTFEQDLFYLALVLALVKTCTPSSLHEQ